MRKTMACWLICFVPLLLGAADDARLRRLEQSVVCPETLSARARDAAVLDFVQRYGAIRPQSRMGERLAARERALQRRGCRPERRHHSFPEA